MIIGLNIYHINTFEIFRLNLWFKKYNLNMKTKLIFAFSICLMMYGSLSFGQTRTRISQKKSKAKTEKISIWEKLNPEIKFGNIGFYNGFYISSKLDVGYKLSQRFSTGLGTKLFYTQISYIGPDDTYFDYGGFLYARGKITDDIFLQFEYSATKFDSTNFLPEKTVTYPALGIGYYSGAGSKWRFGAELFYIFNGEAQDYNGSPVEYWFGATYNF